MPSETAFNRLKACTAEKCRNLRLTAYEKIIRNFRQPDYELWDERNKHLLLVFDMGNGKTVKLSIQMYQGGAEIVSAFEVSLENILGAIRGRELTTIK